MAHCKRMESPLAAIVKISTELSSENLTDILLGYVSCMTTRVIVTVFYSTGMV